MKDYLKPEMEIIRFDAEDMITTSDCEDGVNYFQPPTIYLTPGKCASKTTC